MEFKRRTSKKISIWTYVKLNSAMVAIMLELGSPKEFGMIFYGTFNVTLGKKFQRIH